MSDDQSRPAPADHTPAAGDTPTLFPLLPADAPAARPPPVDPKRGARIRQAQRSQLAWGRIDLEAALPEEHPARAIWAVIERRDLSALYAQIEARDDVAGASVIDPKILLALWVYATSTGEGSAREIWRLTEMHAADRWIRGDVDGGDRRGQRNLPAARCDRGNRQRRREGPSRARPLCRSRSAQGAGQCVTLRAHVQRPPTHHAPRLTRREPTAVAPLAASGPPPA